MTFIKRALQPILSCKLIPFILLPLLIATQCQLPDLTASQADNQPIATPTPAPTLALFPPIQPGDGSDLMDRLLETGILRVGIRVWPEAEFAPPAFRGFSNAETGGALNGFEVDVARLLAEGLGLELELVEAYPPVIASGDWRGQWDIALASLVPFDSLPATVIQHNPLYYSRPYAYMPMGLLIPAETSIRGLGDLAGRKVGVLEHSAYQWLLAPTDQILTVQDRPLLGPLPADIQPVSLSNLQKTIRQLGQADDAPQVEAILGPAPILQEAAKSDLPVKLLPEAKDLGLQPLVIATISQDGLQVDRLLLEINNVLERLQRRGALAEVYLRWYDQDLSQFPTLENTTAE